MVIFLYEFSHFLAASLAILVCLSSFALFILTFRYERQLQTVWRALGFILLGLAFLLLIWERKEPSIDFVAVLVQAFALYFIFRGVRAEPKLVHLTQVPGEKKQELQNVIKAEKNKLMEKKPFIIMLVVLFLVLLFLLPGYIYLRSYLPPLLEAVATLFVVLTIFIQVKRYRADKHIINLWPLIGYIFLLVRGLAMFLYRLPEPNIVFLRQLTLDYSLAWQIGTLATFFAFLFLGIWAWNFVKVRIFLRTYVVFISLVILVSTIGALVFTLFIFKIIENNNLELMLKGAQTEAVVMNDRANTAMFVSRLMSEDVELVKALKSSNFQSMDKIAQRYLDSAEIDILRIYNIDGEVISSPSDPRDKGKVIKDDEVLTFSILQKSQVRTFDTYPQVLAPYMVARAVHPLLDNNAVIGIVEVGYKFDNAFVDFSKEKTSLDVSIYTGSKISATTIKTEDNKSRYLGTEEVNKDVLTKVLKNGEIYTTTTDRFGVIYYMAYTPMRNVNGKILGMVAVGSPTYLLIDAMRQQLVTTFILVSLLSALISLIGYYAMPSLRLGASQFGKQKK